MLIWVRLNMHLKPNLFGHGLIIGSLEGGGWPEPIAIGSPWEWGKE